MINYNPKLPLFYIHIPKSGGSTVRDIFQKRYGKEFWLCRKTACYGKRMIR